MDSFVSPELEAYLKRLDEFIVRDIDTLQNENDNNRFFDYRSGSIPEQIVLIPTASNAIQLIPVQGENQAYHAASGSTFYANAKSAPTRRGSGASHSRVSMAVRMTRRGAARISGWP